MDKEAVGEYWVRLAILCSALGTLSIAFTQVVLVAINKSSVLGLFGSEFILLLTVVQVGLLEDARVNGPYYQQMPMDNYQIGRTTKSAMDMIISCIAILLRLHAVEINYCIAWIAFAAEFRVFKQLQYGYCDFSSLDLFSGAFMQIFLVYEKENSLLAWIVKLTLYVGVIYIMYWFCQKSNYTSIRAKDTDDDFGCGIPQVTEPILLDANLA